jgi:ubiquinol-cytochrome c reductase cytochrome b subunit
MTTRERLSSWLDERTGHKKALRAWQDRPVAGGARWAYALGAALGLTLVVEVATGALLSTAYAPSVESAWASVHYITYSMSGGWVVRGLHHYGSDAVIILVGLHLFQVAAYGAYKRPREVTWWLGLALLGVTLGLSLTGYLLPWDQKGYWARHIETNIAGSAPLVGPWVQSLIQGGPEYGSLTLARFHALHVVILPFALLGLLALHVTLARKHGNTPSPSADVVASKAQPFYPDQVAKNLLLALGVLAVVLWLAVRHHGAPLDAPADPTSDYPARPEWYLVWVFRLMRSVGGEVESVGALLLPLVVGGYLVLLPLVDKKPSTALRSRLLPLAPMGLLVVAVLGLTYGGIRADDDDAEYQRAHKNAEARAELAVALARAGVPPTGPLAMLRADPELHGEELFAKNCAACHVLGELGDRKKASAPTLDGWGTTAWILQMIHAPDDDTRFGRTPYKGQMPSMDVPPKDQKPGDPPFKPMSADEMRAVATFLASQGEGAAAHGAELEAGEKIVTSRCTTCHLWKGEGDDGDQGLAPELAGYGSIAWVRAQIGNPATKATYRPNAVDDAKSKGHMPHFAGELADADIDLLARWTRARARGVPLGDASQPTSTTPAPATSSGDTPKPPGKAP